MPAHEKDIDQLENEALARGWTGNAWQQPLRIKDQRTGERQSRAGAAPGEFSQAPRQGRVPPPRSLRVAGRFLVGGSRRDAIGKPACRRAHTHLVFAKSTHHPPQRLLFNPR